MIELPNDLFFQKLQGPFFLYSERKLREQVKDLKKKWQTFGRGQIYFSLKSNPNPYLLSLLKDEVDAFDVSSENELRLILDLGVDPQRISFSGPAKTDGALRLAVKKEIKTIHIDSFDEWKKLKALQKDQTLRTSWTLRMESPDLMSSKLGVLPEEIPAFFSDPDFAKGFIGVHTYLGRERFDQKRVLDFVDWSRGIIRQSSKFDFFVGAGLPSSDLVSSQKLFQENRESPSTLHLEAGRAIVHSCGVYGCSVLSVKKRPEPLVIVDGGLQHMASHLHSPRFGFEGVEVMAYRGYQPLGLDSLAPSSVQGSLGLWHDVLLDKVNLPANLQRGDLLLISPAGAYGLTAAANQFVGASRVSEYLLRSNGQVLDVSCSAQCGYLESFEEGLQS